MLEKFAYQPATGIQEFDQSFQRLLKEWWIGALVTTAGVVNEASPDGRLGQALVPIADGLAEDPRIIVGAVVGQCLCAAILISPAFQSRPGSIVRTSAHSLMGWTEGIWRATAWLMLGYFVVCTLCESPAMALSALGAASTATSAWLISVVVRVIAEEPKITVAARWTAASLFLMVTMWAGASS